MYNCNFTSFLNESENKNNNNINVHYEYKSNTHYCKLNMLVKQPKMMEFGTFFHKETRDQSGHLTRAVWAQSLRRLEVMLNTNNPD